MGNEEEARDIIPTAVPKATMLRLDGDTGVPRHPDKEYKHRHYRTEVVLTESSFNMSKYFDRFSNVFDASCFRLIHPGGTEFFVQGRKGDEHDTTIRA